LNMGKVKDKILKEAKESKKKIEKEAASKIEEIRGKAKKEASDIEKKGKEQAKEAEKLEMERILSRVRMELSNRRLDKKNKIMEELKAKVTDEMKKLKWEEYRELLKGIILQACEDGDEELTPGALHLDKVRELVEELNKEEKHDFKVSNEKGNFEVGVVLSKGKRRVNATLSVLLEETFNEMQEEIVSTLFGSE
jgi:vacuolar-type H+-ATPase subunit E/Vma4